MIQVIRTFGHVKLGDMIIAQTCSHLYGDNLPGTSQIFGKQQEDADICLYGRPMRQQLGEMVKTVFINQVLFYSHVDLSMRSFYAKVIINDAKIHCGIRDHELYSRTYTGI